ncbi:hypothetical protein BDZ45DRAFT_717327 [Acephala macrosclerotiorum]|nr:hypothetical protein BDZ45DRAFT_717327 [Acephala macrosclerotiorum]
MADATEALACHLENDVFHINNPAAGGLEISFRRTIRVPDNNQSSNLPPDMGKMSLFKVREYAGRLPAEMAVKGGLFTPMYQSEAMWIRFSSKESFAVKLYVGGVNAISGEPAVETAATNLRRQNLIAQSKSVQDYLVTPLQDWLDGIATVDGTVRQFVAMPIGSGLTVEQQVIGEEVTGGLQFEITPLATARIHIETWQGEKKVYFVKPHETVRAVKMVYESELGFSWKEMELTCEGQLLCNTLKIMSTSVKKDSVFQLRLNLTTFDLHVKTWTGRLVHFAKTPDSVEDLKLEIKEREGIPSDQQRLSYHGFQLEDGKRLSEYGVTSGCTIIVGGRMRGGLEENNEKSSREMGLAAGGLIRQVIMRDVLPANHWDASRTLAFNVQILNASNFQEITGIPPPQSPISASVYHGMGLPFFSQWEEPTSIFGNFQGIKSVAQLSSRSEPGLKFMVINLDAEGKISKRVGELSELDQPGLLELDASPIISELGDHPTVNPKGPLNQFRSVKELENEIRKKAIAIF